ncbi:MAG TPA: ribonuclease Y [Trueperaceae bacterium]|nr:ribonuclease Y [Trueperaceae bacterium]
MLSIIIGFLALVVGAGAGYFVKQNNNNKLLEIAERESKEILANAKQEAQTILQDARKEKQALIKDERDRLKQEAKRAHEILEQELARLRESSSKELDRIRADIERDRDFVKESRNEIKGERQKLEKMELRLSKRGEQQDARALKLDDLEEKLNKLTKELNERDENLAAQELALQEQLHEIAQLSKEQAQEIIFERLDGELEREKAIRIRSALELADADAKRKAFNIIAQAIQRSAAEVSAAISVTVVPIPSDSMKGRIIGREGRNIRTFEALTGVDLIIDDTPEAVLLSSFNPIRREVAKLALVELISDGRIHPTSIEDSVNKAQSEMQSYIKEKGEEAALEANIVGIKSGLLQLLGRMNFRTSYGQNVLKHSVQVSHLCGIIAAELGVDEVLARRAGLLHDVGKSIDRDIEGSHTEIGANLAKRFGEPDEVIDAIAHHHDIDLAETIYPIIVQAADAISAARPGARRESLESYLKRLESLESIATSFPGVEKSYAIQAGREIRIVVQPDKVDDSSAVLLARDVANRIEQDVEYPGQVQVTVVRESRVVEYAR